MSEEEVGGCVARVVSAGRAGTSPDPVGLVDCSGPTPGRGGCGTAALVRPFAGVGAPSYLPGMGAV